MKRSGTTGKQRGGVTGKGFVAGKSGNPGGRPKGTSLTALLLKELTEFADEDIRMEIFPEQIGNKTWLQLITRATLRLAAKGHSKALQEVWERVEGKIVQPISGTSDDGALIVQFTPPSTKLFTENDAND